MSEFAKTMREAFTKDVTEFAAFANQESVSHSGTAATMVVNAELLREHGSLAESAGTLYRVLLENPRDKTTVHVLLERARLDRELGLFEIAVEEFEALLDSRHLQVADRVICLNNLAWLARSHFRDLDLAERYLNAASDLARDNDDTTHNEFTETMHQLAVVRFKLGRLDEARSLIEDVIQLRKHGDDSMRLHLARSVQVQAAILESQGELDAALTCYLEVLQIREAAFGLTHADVADTLFYLGDIYKKLGQAREAEATYNRARCACQNAASTEPGWLILTWLHSRLADAHRREHFTSLGIVAPRVLRITAGPNSERQS